MAARPTVIASLVVLLAAGSARADTFGNDTVYGSQQAAVGNIQVATKVTLAVPATVTSLSAFVGDKDNKGVRLALYDDVGGEPGALLAETAAADTTADLTWITIDLPDVDLCPGDYWLALALDQVQQAYVYDGSTGETRHRDHNAEQNGFLADWGVSDETHVRRISIYATCTSGTSTFTDVSASTGFDVQTTSSAAAGSGFHWADYDGDGDLDAIVTGDASKLLLNTGGGSSFFAATIGGGGLSRQGAMLDIDNDGDMDFWHRTNALYENDGAAGFASAGDLGFADASMVGTDGLAAGDADGDGRCDLLVFSTNGNWLGANQGGAPPVLAGTDDPTYGLNDAGDAGNGDYVATGDVNDDGYPDAFYHLGTGKLFLSGGDGTWTENASGIAITTDPAKPVGSAWADYDNDGDLDLFVPRYDPGSPAWLWRNDGGTFTDVAASAGIDDVSGQRSGCWGDFDNDGDLDLYVVTHSGAANVLYQNLGDGSFTGVGACAGVGAAGDGHDAVFVDYDNDGDLDLALAQQGAGNVLLRNDTDDANYLKVRVIGAGAGRTNVAGIGTVVRLYDATGTTLLARRDVAAARGFAGGEPAWVHFGGVDPGTTYLVRVSFRSGDQDVAVVPGTVSTTIGAAVVPQMLTVEETAWRLTRWQEIEP